MADEKRTLPPIYRVWNFFISVKLAIITLIILSVTSIIGTIIEQNQPPEKYHQIYEDWAFALMDRLGLRAAATFDDDFRREGFTIVP